MSECTLPADTRRNGDGPAGDLDLRTAWVILRRHGENVLAAARPWAYLMRSAQRRVLDEVRAQQLLTNAGSIRGRAREVLPRVVRPVGSTAVDLATVLRHEPSGAEEGKGERAVRQVGRHEQPPPAVVESAAPAVADT